MSKFETLVVGASGNIGREFVSLLVNEEIPSRVLIRKKPASDFFQNPLLDIVYGDLGNKQSLEVALSGIKRVYMVTRDHPDQARLEGNLIEVAVKAGVEKIVKSSAFAAGLEPPVGYGLIHQESERQLMASGIPWVILRPYMFMQNFLELAQPISSVGFIPMPMSTAKIGLIDARDVALAALAVLTEEKHNNQIYELTGQQALSITDCARVFSDTLGHSVRYFSTPYWLAALMMKLQGVSMWDISMRKHLFRMIKDGGEESLTTTVERITGKKPRTLECFVHDHKAQFK